MERNHLSDAEKRGSYDVTGEHASFGHLSNNNQSTDADNAEEEPVTELLLPKVEYVLSQMPHSHVDTGNVDVQRDAHVTNEDGENTNGRETWDKKADFLLSVIGFAVDLGNVWRFPYICYKNGGGAFLIPYFLMLVFLGLPLFYMELALGQFQRSGAIMIWKNLCPIFTGVGFAICLVATYVGMYYNTIIAWALYYLIASFRSEVPWAGCDNEWNTPYCLSMSKQDNTTSANQTNPSALEYFYFNVLEAHRSSGIDNVGGVKWSLCLCLLVVMATIYFALWKGIKSSGKVVWITATVPYIVLLVLLVRGATLPGAGDGIKYYVTPVWSKLLESGVWLDAAAQIFFSLGPGFGTLLALSSYNKFNNNCYLDAMLTAVINCLTSLLAGFVVFSVLGYMAHRLDMSIEELAKVEGPGLVFFVYPEAIATLSGSVFWAIIFFLLLITLGLDSSFGGLESVITAVCDISPRLAKRRELVVLGVVIVCFLGGLPTTTYGGQYVITLLDTHAAPVALIFICFIEAIAVNWFYGVQRFSNDIEKMLGFQPGIYWKICWAGICPLFLFILFVLSIVAYEGLTLDDYVFPAWSEAVGWLVTASSLLCIPGYILFSFMITPGNFGQKLKQMIQPTDTQKPDYYMSANGTCMVHMASPELLPFYGRDNVEVNSPNTSNFTVDKNETYPQTLYTQDETKDISHSDMKNYENKNNFANGTLGKQQDNDGSVHDSTPTYSEKTRDFSVLNKTET